jgi:hypothetical protein
MKLIYILVDITLIVAVKAACKCCGGFSGCDLNPYS